MMILIKNADVFQPEPKGQCDVLLGGGVILAIEPEIKPQDLPGEVKIIDATGRFLVPGFIDGHQHLTGGGGEAGFPSRAPEMQLGMNSLNGVTTAVGLLGTDAITRSVKNLYAKTCAFDEEGITARMLTGSYWLPSPTITGNVADDLTYLDKVIGVKLALSDIRGPHVTLDMLTTLASDVRVASLVAGKPGVITVHLGIKPQRLDLVAEAVDKHGIRADTFVLTHINRNDEKLVKQAFTLAEQGAVLDPTGIMDESLPHPVIIPAAELAAMADENGLFDQVCISSDAGGSLPQWDDERKRILGMSIAHPGSLLEELRRMVNDMGMPLEKALKPLTRTPARVYGFTESKGRLDPGFDADLLILDKNALRPMHVIAKGRILVQDSTPLKNGYFEKPPINNPQTPGASDAARRNPIH